MLFNSRKLDLERMWSEYHIDDGESLHEIYDDYQTYLKEHDDINDLTWNDLEMDAIFCRINSTMTNAGELTLYNLLRKPLYKKEELEERDYFVELFRKDKDIRQAKQKELAYIGKKQFASLYGLADYRNRYHSSIIKNVMMPLLLFLSFISCFIFPVGILIFILMFILNCVVYYHERKYIEPELVSIREIGSILFAMSNINLNNENQRLDQKLEPLGKCKHLNKKYQKYVMIVAGKGGAISQETDFLWDYFRLATHLDFLVVNKLLDMLEQDYDNLLKMYQIVGEIDALIAIAKYRNQLESENGFCRPEFCTERSISSSEMYFPLLDNPVKNSLEAGKGILITGSNATGKSTFLRTVAINALLAQTIFTVCAKSYMACFFKIMTVMNVRDNVLSSDSYYMMEIKSLKNILDQINTDQPILCCMDEILRGTNTIERIGAASEILNTLSSANVICLAASHDIELSYILEDIYDNYHFQEYVTDDEVNCDFILYKDRSYTRNAISLLKCIGYSDEIVERARDHVNDYVETGKWKKYSVK